MDAIIQHGGAVAPELLDEPDMLVTSLTITPQRTEGRYRGPNKATQIVTEVDPILDFQFSAIIKSLEGLCDQEPGTAVASLENFSDEIHGFDPEDGMLIFRDPSRELSSDETPDTISFTVTHFPFVTPPTP
jgi:hypothetical protein